MGHTQREDIGVGVGGVFKEYKQKLLKDANK